MDESLNNLLRSELYAARSYFDRLMHASVDLENIEHSPTFKKWLAGANFEVMTWLESDVLASNWWTKNQRPPNAKEFKKQLLALFLFVDNLILLPTQANKKVEAVSSLINTLYSLCHDLHDYLFRISTLEIPLPRLGLAKSERENPQESGIPNYKIHANDFWSMVGGDNAPNIIGLESGRESKYQKGLARGHEAMFAKDFERALTHFKEAQKYNETAEVLGLLGWTTGLQGNKEEAKSYYLKAIRKDPDYGPPYNDLGSFLLNDGEVEESLKWFELAKKAPLYDNKEYPYINAGRAHMTKHRYREAIAEFDHALKLAPFNEDLKKTIDRLKRALTHKEAPNAAE